ncbi:biotin transport system permease protein [Kineococcus xinjiangensis]|uniref:Biotin transport system permease protein n=1 Tax=Kineococcus xinjiangensis TaxID=512762 RepID=A0A2S6IPH7_9ACTN|nr:CbiQ family ECF transporter T component [Kineococcus xinjiangensis]PPK96157.1 biotin transport system permease protein [Kineococcus xinjiangensis]
MLTSVYRPGTSPLHRARAGTKLLALAVGASALAWQRSVPAVAVGALVVAAAVAVAGMPARWVWEQLRPLRWVLLLVAGFQVLTQDWRLALVVCATLALAVLAAALVTATTRMQELLDVLQRLLQPLRRVGVDPDRVALLLALTLRAVPVLQGLIAEVGDARRARGCERSLRALLVPLLIRTLRHADNLGEALAARGVDD